MVLQTANLSPVSSYSSASTALLHTSASHNALCSIQGSTLNSPVSSGSSSSTTHLLVPSSSSSAGTVAAATSSAATSSAAAPAAAAPAASTPPAGRRQVRLVPFLFCFSSLSSYYIFILYLLKLKDHFTLGFLLDFLDHVSGL